MRVFDVCGTLYNSNTTFDFILEYHKSHKNNFKYFLSRILLTIPFKILNKLKIISIRDKLIFTLKGEKRDELSLFADDFVERFLNTRKKDKVISLLLADINNSLLISASLEPIINAIARSFNVPGYSSQLEYSQDDTCTGRLFLDLKGIKSSKLSKNELDLVVTDNMSDIDLIIKSKQAYLVIHKNNEAKWNSLLLQNRVDLSKVEFL